MKTFLQNLPGFLKNAGIILATIVIVLTACLYVQCDIYSFQPAEPFHGSSLYNPYSDTSSSGWLKANFHAHSIAWGHLSNGHQTPAQIKNEYKKMSYDIACISNYHLLTKTEAKTLTDLPVYEHGYNIFKTHQLVLAPSRVSFFDLPIFQNTSMKQSVLNALSDESGCVVLNHPGLRNGYTQDDLEKLSSYQFMEVLNHSVNCAEEWDIALSAGKPVWGIGNDDMHDATKKSELGVCWTMIKGKQENIISQLKKGDAYLVQGNDGVADNALQRLDVSGDKMHIVLTDRANEIRLIGQNGVVKKIIRNVIEAKYVFDVSDTYIRAEIINNKSTLYLNPVIRQASHTEPANTLGASINTGATFLYKLSVSCIAISLLLLLYRVPVRRWLGFVNKRYKYYPDQSFETA